MTRLKACAESPRARKCKHFWSASHSIRFWNGAMPLIVATCLATRATVEIIQDCLDKIKTLLISRHGSLDGCSAHAQQPLAGCQRSVQDMSLLCKDCGSSVDACNCHACAVSPSRSCTAICIESCFVWQLQPLCIWQCRTSTDLLDENLLLLAAWLVVALPWQHACLHNNGGNLAMTDHLSSTCVL